MAKTSTFSSSSSSSFQPKWDVFLSFYGKDTRRNFIANLYFALDQAGILTFRDDPALQKGEEISSGLCSAIESSKKFVVVISENYARSSWCLDELVEILGCKKTENQIIPVFYYVDPSDLRHQKGSFGEALDYHKRRYSVDMIDKWKNALAAVAELSGYHLKKDANENESDTIQDIVENMAPQVSTNALHLDEHLYGIDYAVEEIYQNLRMKSNDVRAIGICGMGGIGKTTTAKAFFNKYSNRFDISCFIENIKQNSQGSSLLPLLKQLLSELLRRKDYMVRNVDSGIRQLKQILCFKKALIILDDLDQSSYLELLVRICNLFSAGSRIIITTRDANLLNKLKVDIAEVDLYKVQTLGKDDSLKLFSYHAFRKLVPPESFKQLSLSFVIHAGGLPLALKVLGSSLLGRTHESFWKEKLEKVRAIPEKDIQKIIQLSYDELDDETQKAVFLDIAFFFVGKDKDEATDVFRSCDFFPDVGIQHLVDRCLVTIDKFNKFGMHNLIQDMGREIGRTTHTRLFLRGNAWKDLQNLEGRNNVEGLILDLTTLEDKQMSTVIFEKMSNLRLLQIIDANGIAGSFENLLPKLKCIRWHSCPWTYLPSTFRPRNLIFIDMPSSKFKRLWKGPTPIKQLNSLSCLYLSGCCDLKRLPKQLGVMKCLKMIDASFTAIEKLPDSITHLKQLVELKLFRCKKLTELPEQLGEMKGLKKFDAGCTVIKQLPDSITQLKGLVYLDLYGCKKLRKLPEQIGNMEGLRSFCAIDSAIEQLPDSFVSLVNLEVLELSSCQNLRNLPKDIWKLKLLKGLHLNSCSNLEQLPEQLGKMQCLERLYADDTAIEQVPDSTGLLSRLRVLYLRDCKKLRYVPQSIWNLTSIEDLLLSPDDIGRISLPDSVKNMKKLKTLQLSCNVRLCLPMILCFSSLKNLILIDDEQILSSAKPFSLSKLFNLQYLKLENFTNLGSSIPELPFNLEQLCVLSHNSLEQLPDLSSLKKLKDLNIRRCINLQSIWLLPSHLRSLGVEECTSLQDVPDLSMLMELEELNIRRCINLQSISLLPSHLRLLDVEECTSLQDVPDLSMLKELEQLSFTQCYNLKSISLKQSSLQVGQPRLPFEAYLPNREVAEWFNYKSSGHTVSFDIPPSFGSNFLGLALWVVYTSKTNYKLGTYIRAVITNNTRSITDYPIYVDSEVGETQSSVKCITGEKLSMRSGDRIKVSFPGFLYYGYDKFEGPIGEVKVKMCGVHLIPSNSVR